MGHRGLRAEIISDDFITFPHRKHPDPWEMILAHGKSVQTHRNSHPKTHGPVFFLNPGKSSGVRPTICDVFSVGPLVKSRRKTRKRRFFRHFPKGKKKNT